MYGWFVLTVVMVGCLAERFEWLCEVYKPSSKVPAFLTCVDIAGLTKGASTGAGLGNNFLANVRAVDGIFQVVRTFTPPVPAGPCATRGVTLKLTTVLVN